MGSERSRRPGRSVVSRLPLAPAGEGAGIPDLVDLLGGESARSRRFLGGLVAGALVGAAIAGTALLRRRERSTR